PATEFSDVVTEPGPARLRARFMGLMGATGALPLNTTEEVSRWAAEGEDGFVRFADIFAGRFYQLFFRAWSDSHAITQHDRPDEDCFAGYVAAVAGTATPAFLDHDNVPDLSRLPLVSLFGGRVRSAVRLRQMLAEYFALPVEIDEHVPVWLYFDEPQGGLGRGGALGQGICLGSRVQSVNEKIRIRVMVPSLARYRAFLPGGADHQRLASLVFWYLGRSYDIDLALMLAADQIPPAQIGGGAALGWLAAVSPARGEGFAEVARFPLIFEGST
ncbi:MAG: type VI secretion system baseplate subunit TssG, partial [Paracoccus sp. (in: a-proteobacteria)]|nr:type VI secretion system baseplate subunit TssG [Paracoccus sp. (in: a-proteobacteria)]